MEVTKPALTGGAHTQFKDGLRLELRSRLGATIKKSAGPSFDERLEKAVKERTTKGKAMEAEQRKVLNAAIEKGRERPNSAPIRPRNCDQKEMLRIRTELMKEQEEAYNAQLDRLRDKMDTREPIFNLDEVNAAFDKMRDRQAQRRRQLTKEEHVRWEHLRSMEVNAAKRPLLIENPTYKHPIARPESAPCLGGRPRHAFGREEYECDKRIREAVSSKWFSKTDWAKGRLREIKEKTDSRVPLNECTYPMTVDGHSMARDRLRHASPANVRCR